MQFSYRSQIKIKLAKENSSNNNRGSLSFVHKQILMNLKYSGTITIRSCILNFIPHNHILTYKLISNNVSNINIYTCRSRCTYEIKKTHALHAIDRARNDSTNL